MTAVALKLLRTFAEALSLPADAFDDLYGNLPNEHIKLIRYPGQSATQSNQGVGAHKDSGFLSFLLQDEKKGLQVEVSPDNWVDASRCGQLCGQYWRTAGAGHQRLPARHRPPRGFSSSG
ncbi:2-oxoglutarate-dependent ethylene/succinate-forming enzyme [Cedecea neteri]|uniref:2-oxoglutarate-dependent ethylene/succinate-forming enzyme n=1 Tax=Cedecea neteri TaxID=158822 RepID=A0A2X3J9F8_9ENTR|nr:2-oxoglutarate-dependent ethylene/succinate-forming enzyme [Cedecea neteri]